MENWKYAGTLTVAGLAVFVAFLKSNLSAEQAELRFLSLGLLCYFIQVLVGCSCVSGACKIENWKYAATPTAAGLAVFVAFLTSNLSAEQAEVRFLSLGLLCYLSQVLVGCTYVFFFEQLETSRKSLTQSKQPMCDIKPMDLSPYAKETQKRDALLHVSDASTRLTPTPSAASSDPDMKLLLDSSLYRQNSTPKDLATLYCPLDRPRFEKSEIPLETRPTSVADDCPLVPVFPKNEFPERLSNLRQVMQNDELDLTILTSMHNIKYYCNFLYCSFGRPYALIVSKDYVTLITAGIDSQGPKRAIRYNCLANQSHIVYTDWNKWNFFEALKASVPGFVDATNIGFEADHMNVNMQKTIREYCFGGRSDCDSDSGKTLNLDDDVGKLSQSWPVGESRRAAPFGTDPDAEESTKSPLFIDVSRALMRQRLTKRESEIGLIRRACLIANKGCDALIAHLEEGCRECDLASIGVNRMKRLIANEFPNSELCDTWIWMQSGVNTDGAHNAQTSRRLKRGDLLSFNCFPMVDGYYVALERTGIFLGPMSSEDDWGNESCPDLTVLLKAELGVDSRPLRCVTHQVTVVNYLTTLKAFYQTAANTDLDVLRNFLFGSSNGGVVRRKSDLLPHLSQNLTPFEINLLFNVYYWKINVKVFEVGRELLKKGTILKNVALTLNEIYKEYNVLEYRTFGYGHSFGLLSHYYGRETILEIREDNEEVLLEGMVVSMEPHITIPEDCYGSGGYREHDILLIKEGSTTNLTKYKYGPKEMAFF